MPSNLSCNGSEIKDNTSHDQDDNEQVWATDHPLIEVDSHLFVWLGVIILIIGTIGNVLSLTVWVCTSLRFYRLAPYMTILAISDLLTLHTRLLGEIVYIKTGKQIQDIDAPLCQLRFYLTYVSGHLVGWSLTLMTIQKAIAVSAPLRAQSFITRRSGWIIVFVMVIFIFGINTHVFWTFSFDPLNPEDPCTANDFINYTWPWMDTVIAVILPFLGLLFSNMIIIYKLAQAKHRHVKQHTTVVTADTHLVSNSVTLIALSLAFLLLNLPMQIYIPLYNSDVIIVKDYEDALLMTAFLHLQYTNSAINFFVYCLAWPAFRKKLCSIFCVLSIKFMRKQDNNRYITNQGRDLASSDTHLVQSGLHSSSDTISQAHTTHCDHSNVMIEACTYL